MNCVFCKVGETHPETVTVVLDKERTLLVFRQVPAEVCDHCGHQYYSSDVTRQLLAAYEEARRKNAEMEVLNYDAAA